MGQGRAAAAGQAIEAATGSSNRAGGGQQHLRLLAAKDNQGNVVAAAVGLPQQLQHHPLGGLHPVEGHRPRGIHYKHNQGSGLAGQPLDANVIGFDKNSPGLARLIGVRLGIALPSELLVGGRRSQGGIDRHPLNRPLGKHRLHVAAPLLGENHPPAPRFAVAAMGQLSKVEHRRVEHYAFRTKHKLVGDAAPLGGFRGLGLGFLVRVRVVFGRLGRQVWRRRFGGQGDDRGPRHNHQLHRPMQVFGLHSQPPLEGGLGLSHP